MDAAQQCTTSYDPSRWSMAEPLQDGRRGPYDADRSGLFDLYAVDWDGSRARGDARQVVHPPRPQSWPPAWLGWGP